MRENKLEIRLISLLNHISYVQNDLKDINYKAFINSNLLVRATSFSIVQIGETMKKIEPLLKDKYPELPWKKANAMRNFIVHDYDDVDSLIVYKTATEDLEELKQHILQIYKNISSENKN